MHEQMNLWDTSASVTKTEEVISQVKTLLSIDGEVIFYENFFDYKESNKLLTELSSATKWQQDTIKMFGKSIPLPRLTAWYGDEGKSYTYSGIEQHPEPWTPILSRIKERVEEIAEVTFNSVLLNLYRDGKDSVSWHSDDEPALGQNPIIASVSFGSIRRFKLKHKHDQKQKADIDLTPGSLLLMKGETQHYWFHQIAKTTKDVTPRINLTFRIIK
jgi:alkylated DNA repair dioxygenase AlkB